MDARQQRGLEIAAKSRIRRQDDTWLVPSQAKDGERYTVIPGLRCSCPDHETRQVKCKHLWAVEYVMERETDENGMVTETEAVRVTKVTRKTYPQNWTAYNAAQSEEKTRFGVLLADLCRGIQQPIHEGRGRPALPLADMLFASAYKVYTGFSSRRFTSDLRDAKTEGLVASTPHFNSVTNYLSNPDMTPILKHLVTVSSLPLKAVETQFAIDSSGFTTSRFIRWYNKKYGRDIDNREWVKVHLMCGVNTHIVTSVDVSGWEAHDTTYFVPLLEQTARNFHMSEVSADKAYLSHKNLAAVETIDATPFVPFKSNTLPTTENSAWGRMYHYFMLNREAFMTHYHRRSNVETVFSMCKAKFGDSVRSKSDSGMVNEVLCKVLCHNILVLIQAIHEFGVEPNFCAQLGLAQKVA